MTDQELAEIIALCEDPNEDFSDVQGRPPTAETIAMLERIADASFLRCDPAEQVEDLLYLPPHVSARLLGQMHPTEANHLLSCLPSELSEDIRSLLPAVAV